MIWSVAENLCVYKNISRIISLSSVVTLSFKGGKTK